MNKSLAFAVAVLLASVLSGCGNKGDLVRPVPSTMPPPSTTPETPVPAPDAPATPAQDSNGH
jgi:predicted small lipoprotein YifL